MRSHEHEASPEKRLGLGGLEFGVQDFRFFLSTQPGE